MNEVHPGQTGCTQEESIEEEQARAHAVQKWFNVMQKKEKKKKKKYKDDDKDKDNDDDMYHPSQDTTMTAKLTLSSDPPKGSSRKLTGRVTHK